jgi:hypothetical protein
VLLQFFCRDIADMGRDIPPVPERILETSGAVAIELIGERANHGSVRRNGRFGEGVYIFQIGIEGNPRAPP